MNGALHRSALPLFAGAAVAAAGLIVIALFEPRAAAAGWLIGMAFWSQISIGSLVLLLIHCLTGGRWAEMIAPVLLPAAAAIPVLVVIAIPLFVAIPALYPWSGHAPQIKPDVQAEYLNPPLFIIRSLIALAGWSVLALMVPRMVGPRGQLIAALGMVFHALAVSFVAIDWYLSLEAPFTSSSFGASIAVTHLIAAMAFAVLVAPDAEGDENTGDLGALLLAFVLGLTYMDFMAVLVIWYGDLPYEEKWFVERLATPWPFAAGIAFILAAVIPIFALMLPRVRASRRALRRLGALVLVGLAAYDIYLIAPPFGVAALMPSLLALVAIGLALGGWQMTGGAAFVQRMRPAHVR
jgi:hypothetical protein